MDTAREKLAVFTEADMPDLDVAVDGALELFTETPPPALGFSQQRLLVLGSGNALVTGRVVFAGTDADFADESSFKIMLAKGDSYDAVVVLSASGGKHAVPMVEQALAHGHRTFLVTNNADSPAAALLPAEQVQVFPKNREPYTYNTSTYLGPILATTNENPALIQSFIHAEVSSRLLRNLCDYQAVTFIIPPKFALVSEMVRTKFDELFGPYVNGRIFTSEEIKHAKTVVTSGEELFIALGVENEHYGLAHNRLAMPLPEAVNYGAVMAILYYLVGRVQAAHPPYFKNNIAHYCETSSQIFTQEIDPIVE